MKINILKKILLPILFLLLLVSCSNNPKDAINEKNVQDDFSILGTISTQDGSVALFERVTHKDIGVAFLNKTMEKKATTIGGFLSQSYEEPNWDWHYSASELGGEFYSVYYGALNKEPKGKVFIKFKSGIKKEATIFQASRSRIWIVIFNEKVEVNELEVMMEDN